MAVSIYNFIERCYKRRSWNVCDEGFTYNRYYSTRLSQAETKAFTKYVKIDLTKDILELPCIYKYIIGKTLLNNNNCSNIEDCVDTLYIPMYYMVKEPRNLKSSTSILRALFYDINSNFNLKKVHYSNITYLGGEGIILYEDYTPLIMYTLQVRKMKDVNNKCKYFPIKPILRINPIVYTKDDILAKFIRSKLITKTVDYKDAYYNTISIYNKHNLYYKEHGDEILNTFEIPANFDIIISDFSDFFVSPKMPDGTFNSDEVNNLLYSNIDTILKDI